MKIKVILLVMITSFSFAQKKSLSESRNLLRIDCKEKSNQIIRVLPKELFTAFAKGEIKAYYPKDHSIEMPYSAFLKHYGMDVPYYGEVTYNDLTCDEIAQFQEDPYLMDCFSKSFEIDEIERFDKKSSTLKHDVLYVKTVFSSDCSYMGLEYYGPVFKYDDIVKYNKTVTSPINPAMRYSLKSLLELRMFNVALVKKGNNDYYTKPAIDGEKDRIKQMENESNLYSN